MRFYAFWLSVIPLFHEGASSRNPSRSFTIDHNDHPVVVRPVDIPPSPKPPPPSKSRPKLTPGEYSHRRLLQNRGNATSASVKASASKTSSRRTSSYRTIASIGKPKQVSALSPEQEEAYKKGYTLQFVGIDSNGVEPRDQMALEANQCMIPGNASEGGGIGLTWGTCPHFAEKNKYGVPTGKAKEPKIEQLWQFTIDGKVRHVQLGKCIRRVKCGESGGPFAPPRPYVYDLGFCDEKGAIKVTLWEARANMAAKTLPIGNALNGVQGTCLACGPFLMQQICKGPCDTVEVTTGWTKMPTSYTVKKESQEKDYLRFGPFKDGLCKSYVKDEDAIPSWWYFHKYDIPK